MKTRIIRSPQNSLEIVIRAFETGVVTFGTQRIAKEDRDMDGAGWLWLLTGLAIGALGVGMMSAIHMWLSGRKKPRTDSRDNYRRPF
jgi:hypothetical protein